MGQQRKKKIQMFLSRIINYWKDTCLYLIETEFSLLFLKLIGRLFQLEHACLELLVSYLTW